MPIFPGNTIKETSETCYISNHPPGFAQICAGILYFATLTRQTDIVAWDAGTKIPLLNRRIIGVAFPSDRLHGVKRSINDALFPERSQENIALVRSSVVPTAVNSLKSGRNILIYPAGKSAPVGEAKWQRGVGRIVQEACLSCNNLAIACVHTPRKGLDFKFSPPVNIGEIINVQDIKKISADEITQRLFEHYTDIFPLENSHNEK